MDVRCERCGTEYEFDDARVTPAGVAVKCTECNHVFRIRRPESGPEPEPLTVKTREGTPPREWKVRLAGGAMFNFKDLTTLQRWIVERKVTRDDEISLSGDNWKRLGTIAELASFFQVVDQAQAPSASPAPTETPPGGRPPSAAGSPTVEVSPELLPPAPPRSSPTVPFGGLPQIPANAVEPASSLSASSPTPATLDFPASGTGAAPVPAAAPAGTGPGGPLPSPRPPLPPHTLQPTLQIPPSRSDDSLRMPEGAVSAGDPLFAQWSRQAPLPESYAPDAELDRVIQPKNTGTKILIALAVLVAMGLVSYYFLVELPMQQEAAEAARVAKEKVEQERAEAARLEQERQAAEEQRKRDEEAARAREEAARAAAVAALDAGSAAAASADAGAGSSQAAAKAVKVEDFDTLMAQADRLREREKTDQAIELYGRASDLEPDRAEPYAGRGLALLDMGQGPQAEASFEQALRLNPKYAVAVMGLAEAYKFVGKKEKAIEYYQRYLELQPNGPEAPAARNAIARLKEQ